MNEAADTASIVVVTEGGGHIWAIVNAIADRFANVTVILETPISKWSLLKRRAKRQGWISVFGQIGTMMLVRIGKRFGGQGRNNAAGEGAVNEEISAG